MYTERDLIVFAATCFGVCFVIGIIFEAIRRNLKP